MESFDRYSDEQLVALVQSAGSMRAFDALLSRHRNYLMKFLRALAGYDASDLDDVVQETLLKAFTHIDSFRYDAKFSTWLLRIGRNEFLQARRKQGIFGKLRAAFASLSVTEQEQRDNVNATIDAEAATQILSEQDRLILVYCDALGFSHQEASTELSIPLGTIKSSLARARKMARQHFDQAVPGDRE